LVRAYRRRYGIETTYRQMNQARGRTRSRAPRLRAVFVGLALVLRNLWAGLHWETLATRRRGGRQLALDRLRFRALLQWLGRHVEDGLGAPSRIATPRPVPADQTAR